MITPQQLAGLLTHPRIVAWLLTRASRNPYLDIGDYMGRGWIFNPYDRPQNWLMRRLPSIRLHIIHRADSDRHLHDHPWNARSIILRGWYIEQRNDGFRVRKAGDTHTLRYGEYHRIQSVSQHTPPVTLFITGRYRGTWGFLVDGEKVPHREYLK